MALYFIRNTKTGELWDNEDGWSDAFADIFDQAERDTLDLPLDGEWVAQ